jgi:hypothetical protein
MPAIFEDYEDDEPTKELKRAVIALIDEIRYCDEDSAQQKFLKRQLRGLCRYREHGNGILHDLAPDILYGDEY